VTPLSNDTDLPVPLRALVLSGNVVGRSAAEGAGRLAGFITEGSARAALDAWFGHRGA
jgi:hypothetical protein